MNILITGGAGFIGSNLADAYLAAGHAVSVLDDFSGGKESNLPAGVTVYRGSIVDQAFVEETLAACKPDLVSHHAAQVSVAVSSREPRFDAELNVLGTITVIKAAVAAGVKKVLFSASGGTASAGAPIAPRGTPPR